MTHKITVGGWTIQTLETNKTEVLSVRLTQKELEDLKLAAIRLRTQPSTLARSLIRDAVNTINDATDPRPEVNR